MANRKIIIDCDPGIDDVFAIATAIKYDGFDVLGITTVAGNKSIDKVTKNALRFLEYMDVKIPVHVGAYEPLKKTYSDAGEVHGPTGLGTVELEDKGTKPDSKSAVDFIIESAKKHKDIEILAIGPLTNIAFAIQKSPETMKRVKSIWSMGGGIYRGNITPVAEFNYWVDPEAVQEVFNFGKYVEVHMIGMEPCLESRLDPSELTLMKFLGGDLGKTLYDIVDYYTERYFKFNHKLGAVIYDLLTVIYAIDQSVCSTKYCNVELSIDGLTRGMTVVDIDNKCGRDANVHVAFETDAVKFKTLFFNILAPEAEFTYVDYLKSIE